MIDHQFITGFVLAGGESRRMGVDKGMLSHNGKPMIEHVIQALLPHAKPIFILANNDNFNHFGYPVFSDQIKNSGPISGICNGLTISNTEWNIFVSCDSPFITPELISFLITQSNGYEAVVPSYKGKIYPLTAIYKSSCLVVFKNLLEQKKLRVKDALPLLNVKTVELSDDLPFFHEKLLININTPEDYEKHKNYC